MIKPQIREFKKPEHIDEYPCGPCFDAGHLVSNNRSYRVEKPIVDISKCVGCFVCYLYCPDGAVYKADRKVEIDYDFCKGCGICANECKFKAVKMIKEDE